MTKTHLPHGIEIVRVDRGTAITCSKMDACPCCGSEFCYFDCDESGAEWTNPDGDEPRESEEDARARLEKNCRIEGVLYFLQHMEALGYQMYDPRLERVIDETFDDIGNKVEV